MASYPLPDGFKAYSPIHGSERDYWMLTDVLPYTGEYRERSERVGAEV
jgi:hypothetical protein